MYYLIYHLIFVSLYQINLIVQIYYLLAIYR
nr:MAG TPA: hypothetical protein [Caudoviricetes sp.]